MKYVMLAALALLLALPEGAAMAAESGMVGIKGGTFTMGSPANEISRGKEEIQRQVILDAFFIGKHTVTQKEFQDVMGSNPSNFNGDNLPVENVTWFEAVLFCNALSEKQGLTPAYFVSGSGETTSVTWNREADGYRLPTEAEWEYACRAGTVTPFSTGVNITTDQANYYGNYPYNDAPRGRYRETTVPVGSLVANPWGLHEMHGNVWEWCWDWYGEYAAGAQTNPAGAESGTFRVNRGGGWNDFGRHLRSAYRAAHNPSNRTFNLGFRLARNAQ